MGDEISWKMKNGEFTIKGGGGGGGGGGGQVGQDPLWLVG